MFDQEISIAFYLDHIKYKYKHVVSRRYLILVLVSVHPTHCCVFLGTVF